jgi:hypothetical protein
VLGLRSREPATTTPSLSAGRDEPTR